MNLFGRKLRSTINDVDELDLLLMKQAIFRAVRSGYWVNYNNRFFLNIDDTGCVLNKSSDWCAFVSFKPNQMAMAVDSFVDLFIHEDNVDMDKVLFQQNPGGPGITWTFLRSKTRLKDLTDDGLFCVVLSLLECDGNEKIINPKSKGSNHSDPIKTLRSSGRGWSRKDDGYGAEDQASKEAGS